MRKKQQYIINIMAVIICIVALSSISFLAYMIFRPKVVSAVTIQAGSRMIRVEDFLRNKNTEGRFITDVNLIDLNQPATHELEIQVGNKVYTSQLINLDTEPPKGTPIDVLVLKGEDIEPEMFVKDIQDSTEVTVKFVRKPNTKRKGKHNVEIEMTDTSENKTILEAQLTVLEVKNSVEVEAGEPLNLTIKDFADHGDWPASFVTNINLLDVSKPIEHTVELKIGNKIVSSVVKVIDTTPPVATVTDQEIYLDQIPEAESFVSNIIDVSEVTCYFLRSPNYKKIGTSDVTIVLEDSYGNKSQYDAKLTVKHDNDPPVFSGVRDIIIYQGQTIPYRKNVIAEDAKDGPVKFDVDSSAVRPNKPGTYEVVYSAVDKAGNKAIKKATVTVKKFEPTKEAVYAMADDILERIIKPKMSKREIAYEIYKYVLNNVAYTGSSEKGDVIKEAYRAMKYRAGDCFTYYSLSEVLLTRAGIDNMMVTRVGGKTEHYWNLINCGDGWYHFDATPHAVPVETFMMTDERTEELTKRFGRNYYVFDRSKYPATPKE
jgi:hypothetical protein